MSNDFDYNVNYYYVFRRTDKNRVRFVGRFDNEHDANTALLQNPGGFIERSQDMKAWDRVTAYVNEFVTMQDRPILRSELAQAGFSEHELRIFAQMMAGEIYQWNSTFDPQVNFRDDV